MDSKKFRKEHHAFLAEGGKLIEDIADHFSCKYLIAVDDWLAKHAGLKADKIVAVTREELSGISLLKTPKDALAVFRQPVYDLKSIDPRSDLILAADGIQDPGNFGSIVRLADWFGISHIVCSGDTADIFNPKTIQATMGAVARVKIHYTSLSGFLSDLPKDIPVYGTFLEGNNIYTRDLSSFGVVVLGNEGQGIRPEVSEYVTDRLFIPNYPKGRQTSESLNVAIAGAVICAEFRRRMF